MVNFDGPGSEVMLSQNASDIVRIMILQRRQDAINAFMHYEKNRSVGVAATIEHVRSGVVGLFMELDASLRIDPGIKEKYDLLKKAVWSNKYEELLAAFDVMNEYVYKKDLTRFDNRRQLPMNIVDRNKAQGG